MKKRLSIDITPQMKKVINCLSEHYGSSQSETIRRAIALLWAVKHGEVEGEEPAMVKDGKIVARLIGV